MTTTSSLSLATGKVLSLSTSSTHQFSKQSQPQITLLAGLGIEGDCHCGAFVQHRSRLRIVPRPENLRQVHLISREFLASLAQPDGPGDDGLGGGARGYEVQPGELGENVTTEGIELLSLSPGSKLVFVPGGAPKEVGGEEAGACPTIVVTGLRNPCPQIDAFRKGLRERCLVRDAERAVVGRKAGVMATVEVGGVVRVGDRIVVVEGGEEGVMVCV